MSTRSEGFAAQPGSLVAAAPGMPSITARPLAAVGFLVRLDGGFATPVS